MATSNSRDVKMTLSVETLGVDEVKKLQDSVQKLAEEGGQAAPEFERLASEISRLGQQAAALTAFEKLANDTGELAQRQEQAAQSASELGARLQEAGRVSAQAAEAKQKLADRMAELQKSARDNRDELARLTNQTAEAKKADASYGETTQKLKDKKIDLRAEMERVQAALKLATAESNAASEKQERLAKSFAATEEQAKAAATALRANKDGVEAAATAAQNLGVSTDNVAAAQVQLVQSLNAAGDAARRRKESVDETRESDRLLAIESKTLAAELEKGRIALLAENAAQLDVAAQVRATTRAKEEAAAAAKAAEDAWQQEAYALVEAAEAAQKLKLQTEALAEAQRVLSAGDAFEKQYQEARKLEEAERYVRELGQALDKLETDQQQAATSAKEAADKISNAFKSVGVRSAEELRAEIVQVREAMVTIRQSAASTGDALNGAFSAGQARIKELERDIREVSGTLTMADKAADLFKNSMGQITAGNVVADGVGYLVEKVKELGREFLGAIVQGDQMRRGLTAIYKDAGIAASQIDFLRKSSSESGVAFGQLTGEFVKFSAAMHSANIPLAQSNDLFKALTATSAALGLNTETTGGALNALAQMASKGCHGEGALIRMADGTVCRVEDVRVGDALMGPDGRPRAVLMLARGVDDMLRVHPAGYEPFVVNAEHKARLVRSGQAARTVVMRDWASCEQDLWVHAAGAVPFSVEPIGAGPFFGFLISGDHLYLDAAGFEHHNTVSLEELRQQLGDRIPGALGLAAKGLGITEAQLIKLVESGGLATRDFIVPFTNALKTLNGETDGLVATWSRFKGVLTQTAQAMGDAGWTTALTLALKGLVVVVGTLANTLVKAWEGLRLLGLGAVAVSNAIMGNKDSLKVWQEEIAKSSSRMEALDKALATAVMGADNHTKAAGDNAAMMSENTKEVLKSINANTQLSGEQRLAALSTALAGDAALNASAKLVQYNVAASELIKTQQGQTEALAKTAKAAKEQGDTLVALAQLTGDATAVQQASTQAAELYSAALDKVAESQASETAMLEAQKAELLASAAARKLSALDIKVETEALEAKITTSKAETEQAVQSALAQKQEVYERQLATLALRDHSGEVDKFRVAMELAEATLKSYEAQAAQGHKTDSDVAAARKALTTATVLYKDALTDLISKTEIESKAKLASLQLASAQAKAGADHSLVLAENARRLGDTATAIYHEIKAREQSIAVLKIEIQIRDLEAQAALKTIELKRQSIDAMTEEGKKKLEILDIEKKLIEIKLLANGATKDAIDGLQLEIDKLRTGVDLRGRDTEAVRGNTQAKQENTTETRSLGDAIDQEYASRLRNAFAIAEETRELKAQAERKRLNMDAEGFSTDKNGQRIVQAVDNRQSAASKLESMGVDPAKAKQLAATVYDERGNYTPKSSGGFRSDTDTLDAVLQRLADQGKGAASVGATHTVNIALGGNTQTVNTDANGARVLTDVLGQLASGKSISR